MNTALRVVAFLATLAAVFGVAFGIGNAVDPVSPPDQPKHGDHTAEPASAEARVPGGLMVSQAGYTLSLAQSHTAEGHDVPLDFTITGPDGSPVTAFDVEHEKLLHLIAVRRDFTGFQHVHPRLDSATGVWSTDLDLTAGTWRIFADFTPTGAEGLTLGTDLAVAGTPEPASPPANARTAQVDGYTVSLNGTLTPGTDSKLTVDITKDGRPVTDLQPYLGAYGHLVALREGDLAYLHVHPEGVPGDGATEPGPSVVFYAAVPSAGSYRLYLDFQHEGVVRTAAFTVATGGDAGGDSADDEANHGDH